jgi:hypothetical protein
MLTLCCNVLTFGLKMNINVMEKINFYNGDCCDDLDYRYASGLAFK